jgi:Haem-binding domain
MGMNWKRAATLTFAAAVLLLGALQIAEPSRVNPPVKRDHTLQAATSVPPNVSGILRRACMDCHSHETRWPWYSRIAPLSWDMAKDVQKARATMNLSEWTKQAGRTPAAAIGNLTAICADVKSERMPLAKYRLLHPEARLSSAEKEAVCAWTSAEIERQIQIKRRSLISQSSR